MVYEGGYSEEKALSDIFKYIIDELKIINLGYLSRYIYANFDSPHNFYMLGSMGLTLSIGMGVSTGIEGKHSIYIIDGDGSLLMNFGALSKIKQFKSIKYILIDNGCHNSTGKQPTSSKDIDFCQIAKSCGFDRISSANNTKSIERFFANRRSEQTNEFIRVSVTPMVTKTKRVQLTPLEIKNRFVETINRNLKERSVSQ